MRSGVRSNVLANVLATAPGTLVLAAWEPELAPLRRLLARAAGAGGDASRARAVTLAPVGVGGVDAAVGAARAIADARPGRVIFVGTAGAYAGGRRAPPDIGTAVVAGELRLPSTAALRGDGYLPAPLVARARPSATLTAALRHAAQPAPPVLGAACPLAITRAAALGRRIAAATGAAVENLEAFAVARAAAAAGVPFAAVLGVSNRVGPRAHAEWRAHHRAASAAACEIVFGLVTGLRARSPAARRR